MSHLIEAIRDVAVVECLNRVRACHRYLVEAGQQAVSAMNAKSEPSRWGTEAKRVAVRFEGAKPRDIGSDLYQHNLVEIINQTATVERLIDVLEWVQTTESGMVDFTRVTVCHPSTTAAPADKWENDLVLQK